jgi:hypothetical protein
MSNLKTCTNPKCRKEYITEDAKTDDGFCSLDCWEEMHCASPKESSETLDISVESLLEAQVV